MDRPRPSQQLGAQPAKPSLEQPYLRHPWVHKKAMHIVLYHGLLGAVCYTALPWQSLANKSFLDAWNPGAVEGLGRTVSASLLPVDKPTASWRLRAVLCLWPKWDSRTR